MDFSHCSGLQTLFPFFVHYQQAVKHDSLQINKFLKAHLGRYFHMKILGTLTNFLQLEIQKSSRGIHVHQRKYAEELLALAHLTDSRIVDTPLELNIKY